MPTPDIRLTSKGFFEVSPNSAVAYTRDEGEIANLIERPMDYDIAGEVRHSNALAALNEFLTMTAAEQQGLTDFELNYVTSQLLLQNWSDFCRVLQGCINIKSFKLGGSWYLHELKAEHLQELCAIIAKHPFVTKIVIAGAKYLTVANFNLLFTGIAAIPTLQCLDLFYLNLADLGEEKFAILCKAISACANLEKFESCLGLDEVEDSKLVLLGKALAHAVKFKLEQSLPSPLILPAEQRKILVAALLEERKHILKRQQQTFLCCWKYAAEKIALQVQDAMASVSKDTQAATASPAPEANALVPANLSALPVDIVQDILHMAGTWAQPRLRR